MGVMLALQWLAGYPPFSLITGVILLFVVLALRHGRLVDLVKAGALAGMLAAYHILPFMELLRLSSRAVVLTRGVRPRPSIPWRDLLKELFCPQWIWFSPKLAGDPVVTLYYAGLPAILPRDLGGGPWWGARPAPGHRDTSRSRFVWVRAAGIRAALVAPCVPLSRVVALSGVFWCGGACRARDLQASHARRPMGGGVFCRTGTTGVRAEPDRCLV